ncbi:hypothetical protein J3A83DRAFT_75103 [Scleroderma citrinum]
MQHFQSHSLPIPSDVTSKNLFPSQDASDNTKWANWLKVMGLMPPAFTHINASENIATDHGFRAKNHPKPCSTFKEIGPPHLTCRLSWGISCTVPLEGNSRSIRMHLRMHGHKQKESARVACPWFECTQAAQYKNLARHIQSTHLGMKLQCEQCGKALTRKTVMMKHCGKARGGQKQRMKCLNSVAQ